MSILLGSVTSVAPKTPKPLVIYSIITPSALTLGFQFLTDSFLCLPSSSIPHSTALILYFTHPVYSEFPQFTSIVSILRSSNLQFL